MRRDDEVELLNDGPFTMPNDPFHPVVDILQITLAVAKLPLFILVFSLSFIYSAIGWIFPIAVIGRMISRTASGFFFRVILLLCGVLSTDVQPTPLIDTYSETQEVKTPGPGDIILVNCASYLNLFWLQCKFSPVFAIPVDATRVVVKNVYHMFMDILSSRDLRNGVPRDLGKVVHVAKTNLACPVVVFPEAAVTNGRCLLQFQDFGGGINPSDLNFHIWGFIHQGGGVSVNFTSGSGYLHLFKIFGRFSGRMKVKACLPQDVPKTGSQQINTAFIERARFVMGKIMRVRLAEETADDFVCYVNSANKKPKIHKE
jgi:hypothetical protein